MTERELLAALVETAKVLNDTLEVQEVLLRIIEEAKALTGGTAGSVFLVDETTGDLVFYTTSGGADSRILQSIRVPMEGSIAGEVARTGKPLIVNHPERHPLFFRDLEEKTGFHTENLIAVPLEHQGKILGVAEVLNKPGGFGEQDLNVLSTLAEFAAIALQNARLYERQRRLFHESIRALVAAVDARDPYTAGHSERVAQYVEWLVRRMDLAPAERATFVLAALLHDIGKISIPDRILLKEGRLTEEEYRIMKTHPEKGVEILKHVRDLASVLPGVLHHHERWDGRGYPFRLSGESIPLQARVIAIADTFDALTTDRPYRKGLPPEKALKILQEDAGTHFDPRLVPLFVEEMQARLDRSG